MSRHDASVSGMRPAGRRGAHLLAVLVAMGPALVAAMILAMASATVAYQAALLLDLAFRTFVALWLGGVLLLGAVLALGLDVPTRQAVRTELSSLVAAPWLGAGLVAMVLGAGALGALNTFWTDDDWGHLQRIAVALADPGRPITLREDFLVAPFDVEHAYFISYAQTMLYGAAAWLTGIAPAQWHFNVGGAFGIMALLCGSYLLLRTLAVPPVIAAATLALMLLYLGFDQGWHAVANRALGKPWMFKHLSLLSMPPFLMAALAYWMLSGSRGAYLLLTLVATAASATGANMIFALPVVMACFGLALLASAPSWPAARQRFVRLLVAVPSTAVFLFVAVHYLLSIESGFRSWVTAESYGWHIARAFATPGWLAPVWPFGDALPFELALLLAAALLLPTVVRGPVWTAALAIALYLWLLALVLSPWSFRLLTEVAPGISLTFFRLFLLLLFPLPVALCLVALAPRFGPRLAGSLAAAAIAGVCLVRLIAPQASSLGPNPLGLTPNVPLAQLAQFREIVPVVQDGPILAYHRFAKVAPLLDPGLRHLWQSRGGLLNGAVRVGRLEEALQIYAAAQVLNGARDDLDVLRPVLSRHWACSVVTLSRLGVHTEIERLLDEADYREILSTADFGVFATSRPCGTIAQADPRLPRL